MPCERTTLQSVIATSKEHAKEYADMNSDRCLSEVIGIEKIFLKTMEVIEVLSWI